MQNTPFSINKTLNIRGQLVSLDEPQIMGILNITPDSFFDGGRYPNETAVLNHVAKMVEEGAAFVDVGGYSSRPGATHISAEEEISRAVPTVKWITREFPKAYISIDTFRAQVARAAVGEGASLVNDISGGSLDVDMFSTVAHLKVPYILMHMRGTPQSMTQETTYDNLLKDITDYFHKKIHELEQLDVKDIIVDPGFGFAKTREHGFELLDNLHALKILGKPILAGLSRKSMIWKTLGVSADEALNGTTSLNTIALMKGASILRVHDVKAAREVITLFRAFAKDRVTG